MLVRPRTDLIDDIGFEINVERAGDVLSAGSLREESAEAIVIGRWRAFNKTAIRL